MPSAPEDRTTITIGAALIKATRARAEDEGRGFSEVVASALAAYLAAPSRPDPATLPGLLPVTPGLRAEVEAMLAELRVLVPAVTAAVGNHDEVMDQLDQITAELGRREGAALALERIAAPPGDRGG